jgi:hypothetical protein
MNITYQSVSALSLTILDGKPDLELGCQVGDLNEGIQPTYGMCAEGMGFDTFIMTIKWQEFTNKNMYY